MNQTNAMKKVNFSSALWYIVIVGGTMGLGFLSGLLSGRKRGLRGLYSPASHSARSDVCDSVAGFIFSYRNRHVSDD